MKLLIVRHGLTDGNVEQRFQYPKTPLNDEGFRQARQLAQRLKDEPIDIIYSSTFERCRQTTEEIRRFHQETPVVYTPILREREKGILTGHPKQAMIAAIAKSGLDAHEYRPPQGESFIDLCDRLRPFLEKLMKEHKHQTVLIVTHSINKRAILKELLDFSWNEASTMKTPNTSLSIIHVHEQKPHKAHLLCDVAHLSEHV